MSKTIDLRNSYHFNMMLVDRTDRSLDGCNTLREEVEMLKEANRNLTAKLEQLEPQIAAKSVIGNYILNTKQ